MQISSIQLAASLTGIAAKPATEPGASTTESATSHHSAVEKSNESNPDRDAQGQGDGLGRPGTGRQPGPSSEQRTSESDENSASPGDSAPLLPDEPPSQLDLLG